MDYQRLLIFHATSCHVKCNSIRSYRSCKRLTHLVRHSSHACMLSPTINVEI